MEGGVGMVHSSEQSLDLELTLGRTTATLVVRGTGRGASTELLPSGPGRSTERSGPTEERFEGPVVRDGAAYVLALHRVGSAAYWPREFTWRCEPAAELRASHARALRCRATAALSSLPWENVHFSQVPIVLAPGGVANDITWDGEAEPHATVR
jgi:hypothetical protein